MSLETPLLVLVLAALAVSYVGPFDRTTWWLEVTPVLIGLPLVVATRRRFPLSAAALALGQGADEFLGTQGDPWDTQWEMFLALVGSLTRLESR